MVLYNIEIFGREKYPITSFFVAESLLVQEKVGCKDIVVFNSKPQDVDLEKCAREVSTKSECGKSFFYNKDKGKCFCERRSTTCARRTFYDINEYSLANGKYRNKARAEGKQV